MNFGTPVPLLLGIFMVICGVALFFLERLKPGYERDSDKVYAILFLLSGVFLLGNLTMDIIPSFQQMLMVGMLVSLMIQNINSRTPLPRAGFQGDGGDFGGGGYRAPRGGRPPAYAPDNRTNLRAELDRRDYGPVDPYNRPRPMLEGRGEPERPPYNADVYGDGRPMRPDERPPERPMDRPMGNRPMDRPMDRPPESPYGQDSYGGSPRPADERLRRRRPPKNRGEYNDRYRNDPGMPPYRPDRDQL
ncbi:MAG TPA: Ycf66 family protein [Nodosilinea sp.]|nr:Ycf66 family protein [Nodosilinea sp.]